jgi:hypothetical protein
VHGRLTNEDDPNENPDPGLGTMKQCPQCKNEKIVTGWLYPRDIESAFVPYNLRWWSFRLKAGVRVELPYNACFNCGLVWSTLQPDELKTMLDRYGKHAK